MWSMGLLVGDARQVDGGERISNVVGDVEGRAVKVLNNVRWSGDVRIQRSVSVLTVMRRRELDCDARTWTLMLRQSMYWRL